MLMRLMMGITMFSLLGIIMPGEINRYKTSLAGAKDKENSKFGVLLTTDRVTYTTGQPITMEFCVFNHTRKELILHFRNAKRFDFTIENKEGKEVWRWSEGKMFAQMLGKEKFGDGKEEVIYTAQYKGKLDPVYTKSTES